MVFRLEFYCAKNVFVDLVHEELQINSTKLIYLCQVFSSIFCWLAKIDDHFVIIAAHLPPSSVSLASQRSRVKMQGSRYGDGEFAGCATH